MKFSSKLIRWHEKHGRKDLPWQIDKTPYKVWISEIMLQQTQVVTVIPFFSTFIKRFPNIQELANSSEEEVMSFWSGLGYYSRARNIYKTAQILQKKFELKLPSSLSELISLPGIGPSTAGAILSLGYKKRAPILDANVKRVLARYKQIEGDLSKALNIKTLWRISESLTPEEKIDIYNQAIMDLGALVCTRSSPKCRICPVSRNCIAFNKKLTKVLPSRKLTKQKPFKTVFWLIIMNKNGKVLLKKRNNLGVWKGLWSFLESENIQALGKECLTMFKKRKKDLKTYPDINHSFSHLNLNAKLFLLKLNEDINYNINKEKYVWVDRKGLKALGIPTPVKNIFEVLKLNDQTS